MRRISDKEKPQTAPGEGSSDGAGSFSGVHRWVTDQGDVIIDAEGDTVFVAESFDAATSAQLHEAIMAQAKGAGARK
jgi:hypothetical protein